MDGTHANHTDKGTIVLELVSAFTFLRIIIVVQPKTFPHSVMPFTRPRSAADIMTRSLLPAFDGLNFGLSK